MTEVSSFDDAMETASLSIVAMRRTSGRTSHVAAVA